MFLDYESLAKRFGFTHTNYKSDFQPVAQRGNEYISPGVDQYKGGVWKKFDKKGNRLGTYDAILNKISK
ncbi:toxin C-terminal domain-containing protein [Cylindrospermum stagnale]|uniref:toxin C-terminal domain-containing protein n=1 Tax=Cylindrospermum stagnale TaxID=142864 RepID=UPI0002F53DA0